VASIEKRVRAGKTTYRVRYCDPAGRQRSKVFRLKADADGWLTDNDYAKRHRAWVAPAAGKVRLGEWAERWYATTAALRPTTRRDYRKLLDLEILPTFAAAPIASIDTLAVREWLAALAARGLGPKRAGKGASRALPAPGRRRRGRQAEPQRSPPGSSRPGSSGPRCASWTPAKSRRSPRRSTRGTRP